jgi:hypothetical protein
MGLWALRESLRLLIVSYEVFAFPARTVGFGSSFLNGMRHMLTLAAMHSVL